ncbi:MAG: 50S ribosomal protein L14 [Candidatus Woesebacteria bacterium GW2011_GWB1_44_11]|uniref:Large ribosomal subunit protein uL14 n=1 Tax=Candidatus Woesebacteria bacterium GW2011_GWB1_44_11 TaxID=1618579 RepID=A0A837I5Q5_9BACT|nr:MAG: 50S ribosomal protein L14 [Candidatus Woesebacteria bacterium GW2011_GWB1_44_11]
MLQLRTMMVPADNSGAKRIMIIGVPGRVGRFASLGDVVLGVVKGADPAGGVVKGADPAGIVADHEKVRVLIVRTHKEVGRKDGSYVRFDDNAGVVIDKQGLPRGTRILGPIAREIKEAGYNKIASLAREVV